MKKCSIAVLFWALFACSAQSVASVQVCVFRPEAPVRHVVTPHDTLWRLANQFFLDPGCWHAVWSQRHDVIPLIYPGHVIEQDQATGLLRLTGHADARAHTPLTTVDRHLVSAYLRHMLTVPDKLWEQAPRILVGQDGRRHMGTGDRVYVSGDVQQQTTFRVVRQTRPLVDPDTGRHLGDEVLTIGRVRLVSAGQAQQASLLTVEDATREMAAGDRLLPWIPLPLLTVAPHAPQSGFDGKVMSMSDGEIYAGQFQVVTVNKGTADALDTGTVLGVYRTGRVVRNAVDNSTMRLPDMQLGVVLVVQAAAHVSHALIMHLTEPVRIGDSLRAVHE